MIYSPWDIEQKILKLVILGHFLPFYRLKTPKIKILSLDILKMCTKNHNHMIYVSWDTKWNRQNFLSFWAIFSPFTTPLLMISKPKKSKFFKKWQKFLEILSFHTYMCTINEDHLIHGSWKRFKRSKIDFW